MRANETSLAYTINRLQLNLFNGMNIYVHKQIAICEIGDVQIGRDTALTPQLNIREIRFVLTNIALQQRLKHKPV